MKIYIARIFAAAFFLTSCTPRCSLDSNTQNSGDQAAKRSGRIETWVKRSLNDRQVRANSLVLNHDSKKRCTSAAFIHPKFLPIKIPLSAQNQDSVVVKTESHRAQFAYALTACASLSEHQAESEKRATFSAQPSETMLPSKTQVSVYDETGSHLWSTHAQVFPLIVRDSSGLISGSQEYCDRLQILKIEIPDSTVQTLNQENTPLFAFQLPEDNTAEVFALRNDVKEESDRHKINAHGNVQSNVQSNSQSNSQRETRQIGELETYQRELIWTMSLEETKSLQGLHGDSKIHVTLKTQNSSENEYTKEALIYWSRPQGNTVLLGFGQDEAQELNEKQWNILDIPNCIKPILDTLYEAQTAP